MAVLKGIDNVLRNLNKEIKGIENRTQAGLTAAALKVKRESQKLTPVDTGNLKASAYVISGGSQIGASPNFKEDVSGEMGRRHSYTREDRIAIHKTIKMPSAEIGYTASYAIYVHEILRTHMKYDIKSGGFYAVGQWKFLETALYSNQKEILRVIKSYARIK